MPTDDAKIEQVVTWLQEAELEFRSGGNGGYPDLFSALAPGDAIVCAGTDHDGEPTLSVYTREQVLRMYDAISARLKDREQEVEDERESLWEIVNECMPD